MTSWRDHCRPIIARVLAEAQGQSESVIRKALREAYPYGERAMHPYKIWCDEIKRQRGLKPASSVDRRRRHEADVNQAQIGMEL